MHKEIDIAFALLRAALERTVPTDKPIEANEWWSLFRLLQKNHVVALASEAFTALPQEELPPRAVLIPWLSEQQKAANWYHHQCEVQETVVALMQRHEIKTLVLKGTHLAKRYPREELREFGDIDLYFYDRHHEADTLASREFRVEIFNHAHHHSKYDLRGVTVESHYDFVNTHYPPSNRRYEALLKELVPSPTFEVLFLLRHMAGHFAASRITLRDLVDWTLTCRALHDQVDWSSVQNTAAQYGMSSFAAVLSAIVERRFGTELPLKGDVDSQTVARVEHDIVYGDPALDDTPADGLPRLIWKFRRYRALAWKRHLVYNDPAWRLLLSSLTAHVEKPQSIMHKL